ncbi:MAG TPA: hypothetical protein VFP98_02485, partial [Candidatus Polarisedimenticolia bacterium]|nr:hypothetical protein [Candidatus Polarisedimenticolia bacterium]
MSSPSRRSGLRLLAALGLLTAAGGNIPPTERTAERRAVAPSPDESIVITDVTIIDVTSGARETAMTVVTNAGRIAEVGRRVPVPPGAVHVDGAGRFLIPGLWDMHAHHQANGAGALDLFAANGVVGTRDMGSDLEF